MKVTQLVGSPVLLGGGAAVYLVAAREGADCSWPTRAKEVGDTHRPGSPWHILGDTEVPGGAFSGK